MLFRHLIESGRAEKCIFCYPRIEASHTTLCAHSCVGRIRYVGIFLYNAIGISEFSSAASPADVYPAHLDILLDPNDDQIRSLAATTGITASVLNAAARSPVYKLAKLWRLALPLHPEYRTLAMVWKFQGDILAAAISERIVFWGVAGDLSSR